MKTIRLCPSCLGPLPPDAPDGLCPACLLKSGAPDSEGESKLMARPCPKPGEEFGAYRILFATLHPLSLLYLVSGSAMISATLRIPKP